MTTRLRILALGLLALMCALQSFAQNYPVKPVRVVVPAPPGGVDTVARVIVQKLSESLGQPFVVENRPGASGTIGAAFVAKAAPDGYTLMFYASVHILSGFLFKELPYDPIKDFTPITEVGSSALIVAVHPSVAASDLKELVKLSASKRLNWAAASYGSADHLTAETLKLRLGMNLVIVPYKGFGPAVTDLVAGQVDAMTIPMVAALSPIRSGRLKAIAITGSRRNPGLPALPTVAESGLPGFEILTWYGIWGPRGLPKEIAEKIQAETAKAIGSEEVRRRLPADSFDLVATPPAEFARYIGEEAARYSKIIKDAHISLE